MMDWHCIEIHEYTLMMLNHFLFADEELDIVPDLPTATRLQHVTKDRARRTRNVRPTTRHSALPKSKSENSLKVGFE